jgi:hypothetical protein
MGDDFALSDIMKRIVISAIALLCLLALYGCKTSGMAMTSQGQLLKINIKHPTDLPNQGEDNLDVVVSNRGVKSMHDVLLDVELPPELVVLDETHGRGIEMSRDPGSNVYHYAIGNVQAAEDTTIRYKVRTSWGASREASVKATAWQRELPGDKLVETAVIKLRP